MALLDVFKGKKKDKKISSDKKKDLVQKKEVKTKRAVNIYNSAYRNLLKPIISEKAADLNSLNKYVFQVTKKTKKLEVVRAIKAIYGILPIKVNFINLSGKKRRYGRTLGRTVDKKKAIVTLPAGKSIQIYEGV